MQDTVVQNMTVYKTVNKLEIKSVNYQIRGKKYVWGILVELEKGQNVRTGETSQTLRLGIFRNSLELCKLLT